MGEPNPIRNKEDLFEILEKKIRKRRKTVRSALKIVRKVWDKPFLVPPHPVDLEKEPITEKSLVPEGAFDSFISLHRVQKMNNTSTLRFREGKTTVGDILSHYFGNAKLKIKKLKKRKNNNRD